MSDIVERLQGLIFHEEDLEEAAAEIERLRALFKIASRQIEKLAFDMPAPNDYTPQFVTLANDMRAALEPKP